MKIFYTFLVAAVSLAGCVSSSEHNGDTAAADSLYQRSTQANLLHGWWISDDFLTQVEKKRSVYASRAYSSKMLGFILNKELLLSHAPQLDGFSEHEDGYSSPLLFDTIQHKFVNDLSRLGLYPSFPDSFELDIKDWSHVEMFFPGTKQRDAYRKVSNVNDALRGILFAGNYRMDAHDVSFDKTGAVTGFADYQFYEPIYDFGEGIDYDAIVLYKDRHAGNLMDGDIYTFNFNADTLYLSHVETDWDKMEHKVSTEKIKLIKQ